MFGRGVCSAGLGLREYMLGSVSNVCCRGLGGRDSTDSMEHNMGRGQEVSVWFEQSIGMNDCKSAGNWKGAWHFPSLCQGALMAAWHE